MFYGWKVRPPSESAGLAEVQELRLVDLQAGEVEARRQLRSRAGQALKFVELLLDPLRQVLNQEHAPKP